MGHRQPAAACATGPSRRCAGGGRGLRGIAGILTRLPLKQAPGPTDPLKAGPPFELPYTLALPDDQRDRWRLHLALLDTSSGLVAKLQAAGGSEELLDELTTIDLAAKALVEAQLAS
jgi:hypothetical protein